MARSPGKPYSSPMVGSEECDGRAIIGLMTLSLIKLVDALYEERWRIALPTNQNS